MHHQPKGINLLTLQNQVVRILKVLKSKFLSKQLIWIFICIPLLSYLVLRSSFNLSLFGDDWEQLYNMWLEFEVRHSYHWLDIKSYLGPYNFSYSYLGILNNFFGLNSAAYFYTSYFCRVLSTISIFLLVKFLTKDKLAGVLSSLVFIFSAAGLETTDWVFNLNTYIGIFLFNLSLICYLKLRSIAKFPNLYFLLFIPLLAATFMVVSTRMHGAVPFIILVDLVLTFILEKRKLNRSFIVRLIIPFLILFFMMHVGSFGHLGSGGFTDRIKLGMETAVSLLQKEQYMFLFFLPGLIGNITLPDSFSSSYVGSVGLRLASISFIFISGLLSFLTLKLINPKKILNKQFFIFLGFSFFWSVVLFLLHKLNPILPPAQFFSILVGGELFFTIAWLFFTLKKEAPLVSLGMAFSLFWLIAFSLIYWVFNPAILFETTSRYLIMGAVGFAIFLGIFISFLIKRINNGLQLVIPMFILLAILSINYWASSKYLTFLEINRNSKLAIAIWSSLTSSVPDLDVKNPTVFFFTTDNPYSLHWNLVFGFPPHMGLTYRIPNWDLTPLPVSDYPTLLAYAKDGSPQKMNGRPIKPVPLDHIYAYHLSGDKLYSQTGQIRKKLEEDLQKP